MRPVERLTKNKKAVTTKSFANCICIDYWVSSQEELSDADRISDGDISKIKAFVKQEFHLVSRRSPIQEKPVES